MRKYLSEGAKEFQQKHFLFFKSNGLIDWAQLPKNYLSSTWTLKSRSTSKPMLHALENWCAWLIGHLTEFFPELYMSSEEFHLSIYVFYQEHF